MISTPTLARFINRKEGVAALEFALIAPIMITLLFGMIEVNELIGADKRANGVASSIADVISRDKRIDNAEQDDIFDAATALMYPNPVATLTMRVSSVRLMNATDGEVIWSDGEGMGPLAVGATITVPNGGADACPTPTAIMAESEYVYRSPIGYVLGAGNFTFRHAVLVCPRESNEIERDRS